MTKQSTQDHLLEEAYTILGDQTPLVWDCGRLCGSICCSEDAPGLGMVLFPGEERRYQAPLQWAEILPVSRLHPGVPERFRGLNLYFLRCRGHCPRTQRPLACRMFPLAPILTESGVIRIVLDPDGIEICPLVQYGKLHRLRYPFIRSVRQAWQVLVQDEEIREWLRRESHRRIQTMGDPWLRLGSL